MIAAALSWLFCAGIFGLILWRFYRDGRIVGLLCIGYLTVLVVLRPFLFVIGADGPHPAQFFSEYWTLIQAACLLSVLWIVVFAAAYAVIYPVAGPVAALIPQPSRPIPPRVFVMAATLLVGLSVGFTLIRIANAGSIGAFLRAVKIEKGLAGLYILRDIGVVGALIGWVHVLQRARQGRIGWTGWYLVMLVLASCAASFAWGNRENIAKLGLIALITWSIYVKKIRLIVIIGVILSSAALLFGLRLLRDGILSEGRLRSSGANVSTLTKVSLALHMAEFDAFMLAIRDYTRLFDLREGNDFWNGVLSTIPRQLWPDKPFTSNLGPWFRQLYESDRVNGWPVTVIGSWFINFGYMGIPVGALISAAVTATLDRVFSNVKASAWAAVAAGISGIFVLSGGFETGSPQNLVVFLFVFILFTVGAAKVSLDSRQKPPHQYLGHRHRHDNRGRHH